MITAFIIVATIALVIVAMIDGFSHLLAVVFVIFIGVSACDRVNAAPSATIIVNR